jgi:hypothetical protein
MMASETIARDDLVRIVDKASEGITVEHAGEAARGR